MSAHEMSSITNKSREQRVARETLWEQKVRAAHWSANLSRLTRTARVRQVEDAQRLLELLPPPFRAGE